MTDRWAYLPEYNQSYMVTWFPRPSIGERIWKFVRGLVS